MLLSNLNEQVTQFLIKLNHPMHAEIEQLRKMILSLEGSLQESIKWNAPNYNFKDIDCITMRIQPIKHIQIILHCGAKVRTQTNERLIQDPKRLLTWKTNDRALATFLNRESLALQENDFGQLLIDWVNAIAVFKN